jgi:hypothetical protein
MAKRKRQTAAEVMAELEADPEWVRARDERERKRLEIEEALTRAELPILKDLKKVGAKDLESVWDLVNTKEPYPKLIPVLLAHLDREYPSKVREGIARALAVPEARAGWSQLVRSFLAEPKNDENGNDNQVKWALHLALSGAADASVLDELIKLAADRRRHGVHRLFFVDSLVRIKDPRAVAALEELEDDPDLQDSYKRIFKKRKRK